MLVQEKRNVQNVRLTRSLKTQDTADLLANSNRHFTADIGKLAFDGEHLSLKLEVVGS